jgi:hypothetical protein
VLLNKSIRLQSRTVGKLVAAIVVFALLILGCAPSADEVQLFPEP